MATLRMRYVRRKKGGWYFQPTPTMHAAGFRPEALGKDDERAMARAAALLAEWDSIRTNDAACAESKPVTGSIAWLVKRFQENPDSDYKGYQPKTQREFDRHAARICERLGRFQVRNLERPHIRGYYRELLDTGSQDSATRTMKTLHLLLELARDEGLVTVNHAARMKLPMGNARRVVWSEGEVDTMVAAATMGGRRSIGLAVRMAYDLGQRLGDVLTMTWTQYDGRRIRLTQSKTGATVLVPVLPELKTMLDATARGDCLQIVVSEETGRPYQPDNFSHRFRDLANEAGFAGKQFLDLRRSGAVRLAEAGCTTEEVVAITGHSIEHGAKILEIYVPRTSAMAENAIDKVAKATKRKQKVGTQD